MFRNTANAEPGTRQLAGNGRRRIGVVTQIGCQQDALFKVFPLGESPGCGIETLHDITTTPNAASAAAVECVQIVALAVE